MTPITRLILSAHFMNMVVVLFGISFASALLSRLRTVKDYVALRSLPQM